MAYRDLTPEEREQRVAEMREARAVDKRLARARNQELKKQDVDVRRLTAMQAWLTSYAEIVEEFDVYDGELPATTEARTAVIGAMRRYPAEPGTEIRTRWN
jgi:hypothetical protein